MNKKPNKPKIILILGMHRCGTSMTTQLVAALGAHTGHDLMAANEFNPDGYWEYNPLVDFHNRLLRETGNAWFSPSECIDSDHLYERYAGEATKLVDEMDRQGRDWCWKDPRMVLFLEFWLKVLEERDLTFIIVNRDIVRMAASLYLRDKLPVTLSVALWEFYSLKIFNAIKGKDSCLILNYDKMISAPEDEGLKLFHFLKNKVKGEFLTRQPLQWADFVKKHLNRSEPETLVNLSPYQEQILKIYQNQEIPAGFQVSPESWSRLLSLFRLYDEISPYYKNPRYSQLYYSAGTVAFSEEKSVIYPNPEDNPTLIFRLPGLTNLSSLRFDPLNDYVRIGMNKIILLKNNEPLNLRFTLTSNAFQRNGDEFLFDQSDPQIQLHFADDEFIETDGVVIEAQYHETGTKALQAIQEIKMQQLNATIVTQKAEAKYKEQVIGEQKLVIEELTERMTNLKHSADQYQTKLKELMAMIQTTSFSMYRRFATVLRWLGVLRSPRSLLREIKLTRDISRLRRSGFFDEKYYFGTNPDVALSGLSAARHYILYGRAEERKISGQAPPEKSSVRSKGLPFAASIKKTLSRLSENPEIRMIRESRFFDAEYYQRVNSDVQASGMAPEAHFCLYGWKEGRNPGPLFDTAYYLDAYEDVRRLKVNPLLHYIQYGEKERRLPKPFEFDENQCISEADIAGIDASELPTDPGNIAVACHLFHPDLTDELTGYFRQIPYRYDLFITTSPRHVSFLKDYFIRELPDINTTILPVANTGRDVAPFITLLSGDLMSYNLVCKVHTKKSGHDKNLEGWRRYMLDQLLGSHSIVRRIAGAFIENEKLGIVWPLPHPYLKHLAVDRGWGPDISREHNYLASLRHFQDMELPDRDELFEFPAGNMFWFRPKALEYLIKKGFSSDDFGEESGQIDGTLAHAIERLTGKIAENSGYSCATVFFPSAAIETDRENTIDFPDGSRTILFIAHDLFRAGAEMVLLHILNWLKRHTAYDLCVLALKKGNDGGKLLPAYRRTAKVILMDEILAMHPGEEMRSVIRQEVGTPDLIYGNTILAATVYSWLMEFRVPFITHVHEMEESIRRYTTPEIIDNLIRSTTAFIPCSSPVRVNLEKNHGIAPSLLHEIEEFIRIDSQPLPDRVQQRVKMALPPEKVIIWGCGTIYWRKGTDLFIETAGILKSLGVDNFLFCWIGSNHWNNDRHEWGDWQKQEERIRELSLQEHLLFLGEKERPKEYFKAGDIYYLPSREDPYPLVCLEAAECELPVICFADAGGMSGFVADDAGSVVPFADSYRAAEAIAKLINQPDLRIRQGKTAREKVLQRHTDDIAVPRILELCRRVIKAPPAVSVVVPVYNHAPFLRERLNSILNQKFRDVEIIILDDASTDESATIAAEYLFHPAVRLIRNEVNSGSPFRQWQKGIEETRGKLVWIAEGDDTADPDLLTTLIPAFRDNDVVMAWCGSHCLDEDGVISRNHYFRTGHYDGLAFPRERWLSDYISDGKDEIINALSVRNTIPNASAALFRRTVFASVDFSETDQFRTAGDWRIYVQVLKHGKLAYFHRNMNYHRIRAKSVVGSSKSEASATLPDYFRMHESIIREFDIPVSTRELMTGSITGNLRRLWPDLSDEEFVKLYDVERILQVR